LSLEFKTRSQNIFKSYIKLEFENIIIRVWSSTKREIELGFRAEEHCGCCHTKKFVADVKKLQTDGHNGQWADKEKA
jgi:hypothetical protein